MRRTAALVSFALLLIALTLPAQAHGFLIRAVPPDGAVLDRSPARAQYWFSESLEPAFSRISVRGPGGVVIAEAEADPDTPSILAVRLPPDLPDGTYLVDLRLAFASDGHVIAESRSFSVGAASGAGGTGTENLTDPTETVWRAAMLVGLMLSFGAAVVYNGVLLPAWGSASHKAGGLPPRVMQRLSVLMWTGLGITLAAQILALLQQTSAFFGADLGVVLSDRLWEVVRTSTRFGQVWNLRMIVLAAVGGLFVLAAANRADQPAWVRAAWSASVPGLALGLAASSMISHAPGSRAEPWTALFLDWAHVTAAGFWAGGLVALAWVMPVALAPLTGEPRRMALLAALRRYSPYAVSALAMVTASGVFSAALWVRPAELTTTPYGLALLVKVAMVGALLVVGALHHAALNPQRWARFSDITGRLGGFNRTLPIEAALAVLVLIGAGWLTATPVPVPPDALTTAPPLAQVTEVEGYTVGLTASPGGPGFNTFDLSIERGGEPVEAAVMMQLSRPDLDQRAARTPLDRLDAGAYETANLDLSAPGLWWLAADITPADGAPPFRSAFALDVRQENAVPLTIPLTALQAAALVVATLGVGYAASRPSRAAYRRLGLTPQGGLVVAGALVGSVAAFIVGLAVVAQTSQDYSATVISAPEVINPTLPTQESVTRGAALLADACGWSDGQPGWSDLQTRLPRTRDDELYAFTGSGFRGLPSCDGLDDPQRWDVVNALRWVLNTP